MNKFTFILEYKEYLNNIKTLRDKDNHIYSEILKYSNRNNYLILDEGLIKTISKTKAIEIILNRFPELEIETDIDGELSIYGFNNKLKKYMPIITNLGYFISLISYDNDTYEKHIDEELIPYTIVLEPKYDFEVDSPKILYHTSPLKIKNKILKNGLSPKSNNKLSRHPERIYLSDSIDNAVAFGKYLIQKEEKNDYYNIGYCIFSIDSIGIGKLYSDINFRNGGYYVLNNIKPEYIKLIKEVEI